LRLGETGKGERKTRRKRERGKNEHDLKGKLLLLHDSLDSLDVNPH